MSDDDEDDEAPPGLPAGTPFYMTPAGQAALVEELRRLWSEERPKVVEVVSWAAGLGDRSENADYQYGKRRLREIDRRVRFLRKRLEKVQVVDPAKTPKRDQVFFGATVTYARATGETQEMRWRGHCSAPGSATSGGCGCRRGRRRSRCWRSPIPKPEWIPFASADGARSDDMSA
jgi:transcription elongation factor GreB